MVKSWNCLCLQCANISPREFKVANLCLNAILNFSLTHSLHVSNTVTGISIYRNFQDTVGSFPLVGICFWLKQILVRNCSDRVFQCSLLTADLNNNNTEFVWWWWWWWWVPTHNLVKPNSTWLWLS